MNIDEKQLEAEVLQVLELERTISAEEEALMQSEQFRSFLTRQKEVKQQIADFWKNFEKKMIENNIKSIKGDFGSITIAERIGWKVDEDILPAKFFKKVVDTTRLTDTYKLEGKEIKGATRYYTKYITKRLK